MLEYRIHSDGSIDILAGGIRLTGGYPAVDGKSIRVTGVTVTDTSVEYTMRDARIRLDIARQNETLALKTVVNGLDASHDVSPLAGLVAEGCDRTFYQGIGMGAPTGYRKIVPFYAKGSAFEKRPDDEIVDSNIVTAVGNDDACVAMYVTDQTRYRSHFRETLDSVDMIIDTECTLKGETVLPTILLRESADFDSALRVCAREVAEFMQARTPASPAFHWCSWYYLYHTLDQQTLDAYLSEFPKYGEYAPFKHIQIDAGYFDSCGDWLDPYYRFPKGLKYAADTIKAAGYEPGIWIGPFMVGEESRIYREHPDWVLKDLNGKPMSNWSFYNEPKVWGYRDSEYYVLDTSHPDAMEYIVGVFRTLHEWGYTLFKTDFMLWGLKDSSKVLRHTPGKTSFEYFRDFMARIREAIGDSAWLGCIAPFAPFIGYADMMRIGGDVGAQWEDEGFGPTNMIMEITGCQYFNNVYWQNDPDAVLLRDFHIQLTPAQIECLALLQATAGGVITTSDPVHLIGEDRRELLRMICPNGVAHARFPYLQQMRREIVVVNDLEQGKTVYVMNPTATDLAVEMDWNELVGAEYPCVCPLHGQPAQASELKLIRLPAKSGKLFFVSEKPLEKCPDNLWKW